MWVTAALLSVSYRGGSVSPHYHSVGPTTSGNSAYHPRSTGRGPGPGPGRPTLGLSEEGAKARIVLGRWHSPSSTGPSVLGQRIMVGSRERAGAADEDLQAIRAGSPRKGWSERKERSSRQRPQPGHRPGREAAVGSGSTSSSPTSPSRHIAPAPAPTPAPLLLTAPHPGGSPRAGTLTPNSQRGDQI